jgi:hypothetical protein
MTARGSIMGGHGYKALVLPAPAEELLKAEQRNKLHIFLGISLTAGGFYQCYTGLDLLPKNMVEVPSWGRSVGGFGLARSPAAF